VCPSTQDFKISAVQLSPHPKLLVTAVDGTLERQRLYVFWRWCTSISRLLLWKQWNMKF